MDGGGGGGKCCDRRIGSLGMQNPGDRMTKCCWFDYAI